MQPHRQQPTRLPHSWDSPGKEEISSLSHSILFLYFFALVTDEGFLISCCYSLELCIQMGIYFPFLLCLSLLFFSQLFVRPPQTAILPFCIFFFPLGKVLITDSCTMSRPPSIVLQALCLSDLIPWIYLSLPLHNLKGFDLGHTSVVFPTFFNLSLNLAIRSSWSEPQSAPRLVFAWLYSASPLWAAKNIIDLILVLTIWWCSCVESSLVLLEESVCCDQCVLLAKLS